MALGPGAKGTSRHDGERPQDDQEQPGELESGDEQRELWEGDDS